MVERSELIQAAQLRADQIIEQAKREAGVTQKEADRYVAETLTSLEAELTRVIAQVQNGIKTIEAQGNMTQVNPK